MPDTEFIKQYKKITETLIDYGWVISPYMINKDFQKIYKLVIKIESNPPQSDFEKENYQKEINELLTDIIFHPLFRAFFVYRAKELNHVKSFSHHIERAILHYYKNDYLSTVLCLLPAIEGTLLSYYGWQYGQSRKPSIGDLIKEIEKCRAQTYDNSTYRLYSNALSVFLQKWIFSDTSTADTTFSYLNRHYVLHGMGTKNYYSLADTHRLIMFFDLIIEFLSIEQRVNYVFIPENNKQINNRSEYYFRFIERNIRRDEILKTEDEFLKENSNYFSETNIPNWSEILKRAVIEHLQFMKELNDKFGKKGSH